MVVELKLWKLFTVIVKLYRISVSNGTFFKWVYQYLVLFTLVFNRLDSNAARADLAGECLSFHLPIPEMSTTKSKNF